MAHCVIAVGLGPTELLGLEFFKKKVGETSPRVAWGVFDSLSAGTGNITS